ncbi:MAG: dihydrofolate reductase family protein, partial [Nitriliruptoraceae bacterium]
DVRGAERGAERGTEPGAVPGAERGTEPGAERGTEPGAVPADAGRGTVTQPVGGVDLAAALAALAKSGVVSLLAEPGPTLSDALLAAGLVDRSVRHIAVHLGASPPGHVTAPPPGAGWELERIGGAGEDLVVQHVRRVRYDHRHP